jgi:hypothetical protein
VVFLLFPSFGWQCTCITHPAGSDGYCIFDSPSLHVPSIWWRQRRSPPATLRCCTNRKPKPRSISPLPATQKWRPICDGCDKRTRANQYSMAPPTHPPPHCQEQGNPSNFRSIHWLRLTATVSCPNHDDCKTFFHIFQQRSPSSADIRNLPADRKQQPAKPPKRPSLETKEHRLQQHTKRARYILLRLCVADSFILKRSIIDALGSFPIGSTPTSYTHAHNMVQNASFITRERRLGPDSDFHHFLNVPDTILRLAAASSNRSATLSKVAGSGDAPATCMLSGAEREENMTQR